MKKLINNFKLVHECDISDGMDEAMAAMHVVGIASRYVVLNPAWNERLNDTTSHYPFRQYMAGQLDADGVQSLERCETSGRWFFTSLYL